MCLFIAYLHNIFAVCLQRHTIVSINWVRCITITAVIEFALMSWPASIVVNSALVVYHNWFVNNVFDSNTTINAL